MKLFIYLSVLSVLVGCNFKKTEDLKVFLLSSSFSDQKMYFVSNVINTNYTLIGHTEGSSTYYTKRIPELALKLNGKDIVVPAHEEYSKIYLKDNILYRQVCREPYNADNKNKYACNNESIIMSNKEWKIIDGDFISKCRIYNVYDGLVLNEKHNMIKVVCSMQYQGDFIENNFYAIFADTLGIVESGSSNPNDTTRLQKVDVK